MRCINKLVDFIIYMLKIVTTSMFTFYISLRILDLKKYLTFKYGILFLLSSMLIAVFSQTIEMIFNININSIFYIIIFISLFFTVITKSNLGYSILINAIALTINQIIFLIATILGYLVYQILKIDNKVVNFMIIILINICMVYFVFKIKKVSRGVAFLKKNIDNQYFDLVLLNISFIVLFLFAGWIVNDDLLIRRKIFFMLIIFSILMVVTIPKSLQLYYKQRMLVKDLEETKEELENKKKEVAKLEKEIIGFSKISHSIVHKQKSLEHKLEELSMNNEIADETNLKERIKNLNKNIKNKQVIVLDKTGIVEIDDMLNYMQAECSKNKIDFQLQLNGNIHTMVNNYINKEKLEILLADHIKNAIIAIGYSKNVNKSILVRLGKLDGIYGLYIYDSGIEFEIETFLNLGKKPCTTHKDSGGTGMGFLNTFDTLKECKASFIIEEYGKPVKNNFTKALKFKFDNKHEFKIYSYRHEEIKNRDKENTLNVENLKN